jgi:hypothetical protein
MVVSFMTQRVAQNIARNEDDGSFQKIIVVALLTPK